jgi:hypothetical protein
MRARCFLRWLGLGEVARVATETPHAPAAGPDVQSTLLIVYGAAGNVLSVERSYSAAALARSFGVPTAPDARVRR